MIAFLIPYRLASPPNPASERSARARRLRQIVVADDLAERPRQRAVRRLAATVRQQRKHQLGEAIRLFEMRIARQDERVDAEPGVFLHACGDLLRIAD